MKKRNPSLKANEELIKRAELLLEKNPSAIKKSFDRDVQELIEGLRVHQIVLEMQKEELRKTHEELEKIKETYADLYEFAPVGYITLDENNIIFRINLTATKILGLERSGLLGSRFSRFISDDWVDRFYAHCRKCLETREKQTCELKLKGQTKNKRYIQLECIAAPDDGGPSVGFEWR
jgi:PAS domain S-box-containing protein